MRTTIDLPDPLFREVKATAAVRGLKLKDFITESLRTTLKSTREDFPEIDTQQAAIQRWIASASANRNQTGPVGPFNREELYDRDER